MKFQTLKKFHLRKIKVILTTGEEYTGMITSHFIPDKSTMDISEISLMQDNIEIIRIHCDNIESITEVFPQPLNI